MFYLFYLFLVLFVICTRSEYVENIYKPGTINRKLHDIITINNITNSSCALDILDTIDALTQKELWAIKMLDATSKVQSGFALGNIINLGSYDECMSVKGKVEDREIKGKYCLFGLFFTKIFRPNITYGIPKKLLNILNENPGLPLVESICIPDSCNSEDLNTIVNNSDITDILSIKPVFDDMFCKVEETGKFTALQWCTLFLIVGDIFLIIICTAYDFYLQHIQRKPLHDIMISFSMYKNIIQLTTIKTAPDQLPCINGIRSISILWIVLGHEYLFRSLFPHNNYLYLLKWVQENSSNLVAGALFAVDSFLLISGLLVMYVVLLAQAKNFKFNIIYYYLLRIFRLSPAMVMMILINMSFLSYVAEGPIWPIMESIMVTPCYDNWWSSVIFIQNTLIPSEICLVHTWYLAVDTQLYCLAPLLFIPIKKWPTPTLLTIIILTISSCAYGFIVTWNMQLSASYLAIGSSYRQVYASTLIRSNAWLIGSLLGYLLFIKRDKKVKIHKAIVAVLWIFSIAAMIWIIYLQAYFNQNVYNRLTASLYHSLSKPFWCISLSWIIFACVHGYGGLVNNFLSNKFFIVFGRLAYTIYLCHILVITVFITRSQQSTKFSNVDMIHEYFGDLMYIIVFGLIWSLCFESPIIAIGKSLMPQAIAENLKKINEENEIAHQNQVNNGNFLTRL